MVAASADARAQAPLDSAALRHSIDQLRGTVGRWVVGKRWKPGDHQVFSRVNPGSN